MQDTYRYNYKNIHTLKKCRSSYRYSDKNTTLESQYSYRYNNRNILTFEKLQSVDVLIDIATSNLHLRCKILKIRTSTHCKSFEYLVLHKFNRKWRLMTYNGEQRLDPYSSVLMKKKKKNWIKLSSILEKCCPLMGGRTDRSLILLWFVIRW